MSMRRCFAANVVGMRLCVSGTPWTRGRIVRIAAVECHSQWEVPVTQFDEITPVVPVVGVGSAVGIPRYLVDGGLVLAVSFHEVLLDVC